MNTHDDDDDDDDDLPYIKHCCLCSGGYVLPIMSVCLFVCLSVCLSVCYRLHVKLSIDRHENFATDVSLKMEERIKCWKSSATVSRFANFLRTFQHCENRAFLTVWLIFLEKLIRSS